MFDPSILWVLSFAHFTLPLPIDLSLWSSNVSPCPCGQAMSVPVPVVKQCQSLSLWSSNVIPVPVVKQFQSLSLWSDNFSPVPVIKQFQSCPCGQTISVPVSVVKQFQSCLCGQTLSVPVSVVKQFQYLSIWTSNFSPCSCDQAASVLSSNFSPCPCGQAISVLSLRSKVSLVPVPVVPDRKWRSCWSGWPARGRWPTCLNQAAHAPGWRHRKWVPYPAVKPGCGRCEGRLPACNENIRMARLGDNCGAWCWTKCHEAWFWRQCHKAYQWSFQRKVFQKTRENVCWLTKVACRWKYLHIFYVFRPTCAFAAVLLRDISITPCLTAQRALQDLQNVYIKPHKMLW